MNFTKIYFKDDSSNYVMVRGGTDETDRFAMILESVIDEIQGMATRHGVQIFAPSFESRNDRVAFSLDLVRELIATTKTRCVVLEMLTPAEV